MRRALAPAFIAALATVALPAPAASAQSAAGCPDADAQPTPANILQLRAATLCLLNAQRTPRGLAALTESPLLTQASQAYSQKMVGLRFFGHVTPGGVDLMQRLKGVGYVRDGGALVGENLAWATGANTTPARIVQSWMASPGHRRNILEPAYREIGLGIVTGAPVGRTPLAAATYTTDFGVLRGRQKRATKAAGPCRVRAKRRGRSSKNCRAR